MYHCLHAGPRREEQKDWKVRTKDLLLDLAHAIYYLNEECKKSRTEVKFMTVTRCEYYYNKNVDKLFRKYEPELYSSWFVNKEDRYKGDMKTGVMRPLKRDP
ncbi:hypothetical protein EAI_08010 [Harpegnathos saltator]|uniref:Uncharacterized protein n=1 Tax=Harpegnathos saltator TaxID=610380 RepID=E2B710_HARSA|nr:hypothetical protein EAI_08010 [Harpegnathos saltator]